MRRTRGLLAAAALLAAPAVAAAQTVLLPPSANPDRINEEARRRLEERAAPRPETPTGTLVTPPAPPAVSAAEPNEVRFTLTAVRFDKSAYFTPGELDALAKPLIGTRIAIADLRGLVAAVNRLYAARGLATARAALPPQDIKDGVVVIRLVEGRIGKVQARGASPRSLRHAEATVGLDEGDLADPRVIERRLRRFNLENDSQLRARLASGASFGTTDVDLDVTVPHRIQADVFVDDNGFSSTGVVEEGAVLRGYRLLSAADRLSGVFVHSRGVTSESLNYSVGLGDWLRAGLSGSHGLTRLITAAPSRLAVRGVSDSLGGDLVGLVFVKRDLSVTAGSSFTATLSSTDIAGKRVTDNYELAGAMSVGVAYAVPGLAVTGQTDLSLNRVHERVTNVVREPLIWRGSINIAKALGRSSTQIRLRGDGQWASANNLPGLLQYQIGGARSVRAYEPGIAAGDSGFSISGELGHGFQVSKLAAEPYIFVDDAQTYTPRAFASAQAAGVGVNAQIGAHIFVRASFAHAIGHHGLADAANRGFGSLTLRF